ncbi:MAG: 3-isopropylmalate dehydrogenase [Gammaproteobacteria bacterium]|nr:3-isopropylmalate dehydrogenase [Gammaproteobacteria bacterium]MYF38769.1 3-isopropylmalate dehydrogenase [Gammaproteobacteria bacterium]
MATGKRWQILVLPGDGIGAEIMPQALRVLEAVSSEIGTLDILTHDFGGVSIDRYGVPMTEETLQQAMRVDAVLLGAVGGPQWDDLPMEKKPEKALLNLRSALDCFANLRPALTFTALIDASTLKPEIVSELDVLIVRELTGGIYFGTPRGVELQNNRRRGFNTLEYDETEIERIARVGFDLARKRRGKVCSVDKANVLEVTQLWRDVVTEVHQSYEDVELSHMYVDNAAMQLVRWPKQFDVILTGNMFGDILSDTAAMLTGSIGMLPSASINARGQGIYEPVHGSAPDIAGKNIANPLATILSIAMMFRYSLNQPSVANRVEFAVGDVLSQGYRTADIMPPKPSETLQLVGTREIVDSVIACLKETEI